MEQQTKRSSFINVFAWISIIFSGFGILIGIMQTVMKDAHFEQLTKDENIPPLMKIMFENFDILVMGTLLITIVVFIASMMIGQNMPQDAPPEFQSMQNTMKIVSAVMMVAMVGLYLYLIKRLRSDEIKNEFV